MRHHEPAVEIERAARGRYGIGVATRLGEQHRVQVGELCGRAVAVEGSGAHLACRRQIAPVGEGAHQHDPWRGIAAIPLLAAAEAGARILILTAYDTDERVLGALRGGAKGYLLKGAPLSEIARAIRAVHAGDTYLEPRIASKVVAELGPGRRSAALSRREREVLRLIAAGHSNKQIAQTLGITERTVKFHVTSVLNKLGAENRAQAVALAGQRGLL